MAKRKTVRIYQVYDNSDPAGSDTFVRTKREAERIAAEMRKPQGDPDESYSLMGGDPVIEAHDIPLDKNGIIAALIAIPMR